VIDDKLCFNPRIPEQWKAYSFKVKFRNQILKIEVAADKTSFLLEGTEPLEILLNGKAVEVAPNNLVIV
ncbi:MAG: glycosyl hydrolase family 65 protein, partial [Salegentibacter sp.]